LAVEATPVFEAFVGVFEAASADREHVDEGATFTFTLVSGAAPEPSTWAMMASGFAGLGYAGYRGARQVAGTSA
jgi:PEP-CTERM motif